MGTVEHDTAGNEVAFRYLDHLGTMVVWESPFYLGDVFFEILSKLGREEFVEGVQIPPVERFRDPVDEGLVLLFHRHASLLVACSRHQPNSLIVPPPCVRRIDRRPIHKECLEGAFSEVASSSQPSIQ